jgi:hypothetical protein
MGWQLALVLSFATLEGEGKLAWALAANVLVLACIALGVAAIAQWRSRGAPAKSVAWRAIAVALLGTAALGAAVYEHVSMPAHLDECTLRDEREPGPRVWMIRCPNVPPVVAGHPRAHPLAALPPGVDRIRTLVPVGAPLGMCWAAVGAWLMSLAAAAYERKRGTARVAVSVLAFVADLAVLASFALWWPHPHVA